MFKIWISKDHALYVVEIELFNRHVFQFWRTKLAKMPKSSGLHWPLLSYFSSFVEEK